MRESFAEVRGELIFGSTKTHAEREVPLSPALVEELARRMEDVPPAGDALVFTSAKGYPIRHASFRSRVWLPLLEELGLERLGLHALRHSAAVRMIAVGWSPKAVQSVLGHQSAAFTLTVHGHLFDRDLDDLAARLDVRPADSVRTLGGPA